MKTRTQKIVGGIGDAFCFVGAFKHFPKPVRYWFYTQSGLPLPVDLSDLNALLLMACKPRTQLV